MLDLQEQASDTSSAHDDGTTAVVDGFVCRPPQSGETAEAGRAPRARSKSRARQAPHPEDGDGDLEEGPEAGCLPHHWQDAARAQFSNVGMTLR